MWRCCFYMLRRKDGCFHLICHIWWEKAKGKPQRLQTYPKEEIKDEDGVLDAQFPAAQSRHACALSTVYLLSVLWILVRFGSIRPDSCHTGGGALRWCRSPRIQSDLFRKMPREPNTTRVIAFRLAISAKLHLKCSIKNKQEIKRKEAIKISEIKRLHLFFDTQCCLFFESNSKIRKKRTTFVRILNNQTLN